MRANRSITFKLVLIITVFSSLIFTATIGYFYHRSCGVLQRELEKNARNIVLASVNRVEMELSSIGKVAEGVVCSLETGNYHEESLNTLLKNTLGGNKEIYGVGSAFEPNEAAIEAVPVVPYFYRKNGRLISAAEEDFQFLTLDWYQIPKELGKRVWSEPYFDEGSGEMLMTSCSIPFYEGTGDHRHFRGVVVADVSLGWLTDIVASIKVLKTGYSFLLSRNGTIVTHPDTGMIMNETIFSLAESRNNPILRDIGRKMIHGDSGFIPYTDTRGIKSWMYYAPILSAGWTLAVVFPEAELFAEVRSLTMMVGVMGLVGIMLLAAAVALISRSITAPLHALADATEVIAAGDFDAELPQVRSRDEVGKLTRSFIAMTIALKEYIRNLTETTAAKERIESELKVATDIQASLLPRIFPAFPDRPEFDIFASMDPAKEVGGDFYDFFFIDDTNLCFLIADVADKGVPAALYMMVAKTLLKSEGQRLGEPDLILASVNNILAADNDSCMFTTVFCAILDTRTGDVRFSNAGHNPPLIIESSGIRYLTVKAGFVLGPMPDSDYETERLTLQPGDTLFLYTDGVTEAVNLSGELYGEPRLLTALQMSPKENLSEMIHSIRAQVTGHANGAPQSDDVTMVAVHYKGA
ncbi:MAG: SpoIIE family protein phosphatase [Proteobacteria bacterium]|nr:SpoIIE family protein phosphatase [Pseudomonadota bacterium]